MDETIAREDYQTDYEALLQHLGPYERAARNGHTAVMAVEQNGHSAETEPSAVTVEEARSFLQEQLEAGEVLELGPKVVRTDIESSMGPFTTLPEYRTDYPESVKGALQDIFGEYNRSFGPIVAANREHETDYQYAIDRDGTPVNRWVQIDMVGLPQTFLEHADQIGQDTVRDVVKGKIFEMENSLAMYQLMERIHSHDGERTHFDEQFRGSLDDLRESTGKKVALLAVTEDKYQAMKSSEFGKAEDDPLPDEEVMRLSGFDRFFSPDEYVAHLREEGEDSEYLLFVRSSDPVNKLKNPDAKVDNPLLADPEIRRAIKARSITFNIDRPDEPNGSEAKINDTKAYLPAMGMGYRVDTPEDIWEVEGNKTETRITGLAPGLQDYLVAQGVDPEDAKAGKVNFRGKPMQASYGCYGHVAVRPDAKKARQNMRRGMRERGPYVVQPEMTTPVIVDKADGQEYMYIDRVFFATDGQNYRYMGGFRSLMPMDTMEAKKGRVHGNQSTLWAELA